MKACLSLFTLLFLIFAPILLLASQKEGVSVERICQEASTGHSRDFCMSTLNDIPMNQTLDIREFAVAAIKQLITYYPYNQLNDGEMFPDYNAFACLKAVARAITYLDDARGMIKMNNCQAAVKKVTGVKNLLKGCKKKSVSC